jgi:hypothetical protein
MNWTHSRIMSMGDDGSAIVIGAEEGWEALPFGFDGGSCGTYPSRDEAISTVESVLGDMVCCVGHLAADADR